MLVFVLQSMLRSFSLAAAEGIVDAAGNALRLTKSLADCGYGFNHTLPADGLQNELLCVGLASEKAEVERLATSYKFFDGVIDMLDVIKSPTMLPYAVEGGGQVSVSPLPTCLGD